MRFVKSLMLAGAGLVALGASTGCVSNESSLYVEHALLLEDSGDCVFETDAATYSSGTMDIGVYGAGYVLGVSLGNQLARLGDPDLLRTETSHIRLEGAEISVASVDGGEALPAFTLPLSDTIPPSDGDAPGSAVAVLQLVPKGADIQPGNYLITITLFGHTLGGTSIEAGEFVWPLHVCEGCLSSCSPDVRPPCEGVRGGDYGHYCRDYYTDQAFCDLRCGEEEP